MDAMVQETPQEAGAEEEGEVSEAAREAFNQALLWRSAGGGGSRSAASAAWRCSR